jgi:SPX domain protein involved in polyphosphate accumulation
LFLLTHDYLFSPNRHIIVRLKMKFAEHLSAHVTPEWNSQYIRYDEMKELLARAVNKAQPFVDDTEYILRQQFFERVDEHFFQVMSIR